MVKCVIDSDNIELILQDIKHSHDPVFDFSGTDFVKLSKTHPSAIADTFEALNAVSRTFSVKLNLCKIDHDNQKQIDELINGLKQTKKMIGFEFIRSLDPNCPIKVLEDIADNLKENHSIKRITIDNFQVTPPHICDKLRSHPTVLVVIVNGMQQKLDRPAGNDYFFKSTIATVNEPLLNNNESVSKQQKRY